MSETPVSAAIATAFNIALAADPNLMERWIKVSYWVGAHLRNSLLVNSAQNLGHLDLLLRAIEAEPKSMISATVTPMDLVFHYQVMLSEFWIGSAYEILRTIKGGFSGNSEFESLYRNLELIRVPLDKHQLRGDWGSPPLNMTKMPPIDGAENEYIYDPKDSKRGHIMPKGLSESGSVTWCVTDIKLQKSFWLDRRILADNFLDLWQSEPGSVNNPAGSDSPTD